MARTNDQVAAALARLSDLLELHGENRFRILSYRRAADAIHALGTDVSELSEGELTDVRGVGKSVAAKVREYCETGKIAALEELRGEIPDGVRELTKLGGLGPKRAVQLYKELGVTNLDDLRQVISEERLRTVEGFGPKSEENLGRALERYTGTEERVPISTAMRIAEGMVTELAEHPAVSRCAYAGSLRRMRETIGDLDILAASDDPQAVAEAFTSLSGVHEVLATGETKTSIRTGAELQVDLRVVPPDVFGAAMQYFTGSKAHNVKVREHAVRHGFKLSEYGIFDASTDERLAAGVEEDVYARLGMPWIPPALREDRGEVEAALRDELPDLVELDDLRGDLQSHSTYSDGKVGLEEMARAAAERGHGYFAVTDHGRNLRLKSLSLDDIERQHKEVARLNDAGLDGMILLHGVELNIDRDGGLDYPDDVLAGFDVVVASIHSHFDLDEAAQTERLIRAISNPHVHVVGHPTGRRLDRGREGIDFDFGAVCRAAVEHRVALEISAHPGRLDLRDEHVGWAREHGVRFAISTDAHSPEELDHLRFGVGTAQRAWVGPGEVINTLPLDELRRFLAKEG